EGWTVSEAANGRTGLERVALDSPTLILLDLMMPEMDGFEFLDGLRARYQAAPPVVVITAKELTDQDRQRLNGGVSRVLPKGAAGGREVVAEVKHILAAIGATA
ncbi:MAG TPA: response regulator, partial [Gemmatimonadales bacterium]|nr:response regulator [Gemmatimonadales bacterium]